MTTTELVERVLARLPDNSGIFGPEIEACLNVGLQRLADNTANNPKENVRDLLRADFSVTVASGTGSLATALTASEPLLIDQIKSGNCYVTSGTTPMQYLPDRAQLGLTRSNLFVYYTIDGSTLRTRNTDGLLTSLSTTVTITGNYVPLIASVPTQLQDELIDIMVAIVALTAQQAQ